MGDDGVVLAVLLCRRVVFLWFVSRFVFARVSVTCVYRPRHGEEHNYACLLRSGPVIVFCPTPGEWRNRPEDIG